MAYKGNKQTEVAKVNNAKYDEDTMRKAAYALNMCTVSVGQIVDYNDQYILEQEYNAILNNLNLKEIPDDEAFLKILVELLNTITFFRIQDKRKKMVEKEYQKKMKNAIWSAVPNIGVIVASGNPAAMLFSLATQVGAGYMNYRREKANITNEREKEEFELEITALEQFNAIQRELFTTAWRIAKEYKFPDDYRLTERQIKQYNEILMDPDEQRKYIRLESIKDNFHAYPPFWYNLAHTAVYIAGHNEFLLEEEEKKWYLGKAKEYFEEYRAMNKYNILREDQITASFALEYVDLLLLEDDYDKELVAELLETAVKMSGCSFDIMQLCAISYLKIGKLGESASLLKQLVNESYNLSTNAKLLSRVYAAQYLHSLPDERHGIAMEYKSLSRRVNESYLFRLPEVIEEDVEKQDAELQSEYLEKQKALLRGAYRRAIVDLERKLTIEFNRILFPGSNEPDDFFDGTDASKEKRLAVIKHIFKDENSKQEYLDELKAIGFKYRILDVLNRTLNIFEQISLFGESKKKDVYARLVRKQVLSLQDDMMKYSKKINDDSIREDEMICMMEKLTYEGFTEEFYQEIMGFILEGIDSAGRLDILEISESDLFLICEKEGLEAPDIEKNIKKPSRKYIETEFLEAEIFGEDAKKEEEKQQRFDKIMKLAEEYLRKINDENQEPEKIKFFLRSDTDFKVYFANELFEGKALKTKTIAILDDRTYLNDDLLFTVDGIVIVSKNENKGIYNYKDVKFECSNNGTEKILIGGYEFSNANKLLFPGASINIGNLYSFIEAVSR